MPTNRYTVKEAASVLGISQDAVRSRIKRGSLEVEREGRRVYVLLVATDQPTNEPTNQRPTNRPMQEAGASVDPDRYIPRDLYEGIKALLREQIDILREQLRVKDEQLRRSDAKIGALLTQNERLRLEAGNQTHNEPPAYRKREHVRRRPEA